MGAWSVDPTGNDHAEEWLLNSVGVPVMSAISAAIDLFLINLSDEVCGAEAEAAAALLLDLVAGPSQLDRSRFSLRHLISDRAIWDKAAAAMSALRANEEWLSGWNEPEAKRSVYSGLLADIEVQRKLLERP